MSVPKEIEGLPVIASVSGGKDSTALMLHLREIGVPFRAVFADTGWEAPETYAYLDLLRERIGPIDVVRAEPGMLGRAEAHGGFPLRAGRWCTIELKIEPLRAYHASVGEDTVSAVGVRAEESSKRAAMSVLDDSAEWGGWVWRPLLSWSVADVIAIHHRHGVPMNPLYLRGHDRVGCYPCIHERKESIALIAEHSPERIDMLRAAEERITALRAERNAVMPGRYKHPIASFFQPAPSRNERGGSVSIDEVVAWSRDKGRQLPLLAEPPSGGCFRWGMCEPPSKGAAE